MTNGDEHRGEKIILYISRFAADGQGTLYHQQLEEEGYAAVIADSGFSASALLLRGEHVAELVVMGRKHPHDLDDPLDFVPGMDQLEATIVAMDDSAPPVLIHSSATPAVAKEHYAGRPLEAHIVAYVQKCGDPKPFLTAVHDVLYPAGQ